MGRTVCISLVNRTKRILGALSQFNYSDYLSTRAASRSYLLVKEGGDRQYTNESQGKELI